MRLSVPLAMIPPLTLGGCAGVLDPVGPIGAADAIILVDALLIMLCVAIPTIALAFFMAWRYRASNRKAAYLPQWAFSGRIEAVTWAIPTLVIMFLGGIIWIGSHQLDPFRRLPSTTPPEEVQVVSLDWKWLFIYPREGIAAVNQLVLPTGAPVHFSITSASVFNAFFIPRLGSMIYSMPGMVSQLWLRADRPAFLDGQSAHFSGDGFSDMRFVAHAVAPAQFAAWIQGARGAGAPLDRAAYARLARQSQNVAPFTYGAVESGAVPGDRDRSGSPGAWTTAGERRPCGPGSLHRRPDLGRRRGECSASSAGRRSRSTSRSR